MSRLAPLARGIWEFVVGDDWLVALGVVLALGATALLSGTGASVWWITPLSVIALLAFSLRRAAR